MKCVQISGMISIIFAFLKLNLNVILHWFSFYICEIVQWKSWLSTRKSDQPLVLIDCCNSINVWLIHQTVFAIWLNGIWHSRQSWWKFQHEFYHTQTSCLATTKSKCYNCYGKLTILLEKRNKQISLQFPLRAKTTNRADWQSEFRNNSMFKSIDLKRWYVITPARAREETNNFIQALQRASRGMQFNVSNPRVWVCNWNACSTQINGNG